MKVCDRLLAREFAPILFQGLGVFSILVAFAIYFREGIKMVTEYEVGMATVGKFVLLGFPYAVAVAIPMSVLFASLMAFSRLSERGEMRAILTCGMSLRRFGLGAGVAGLLASLAAIGLNESVIPRLVVEMEDLKQRVFQEGGFSGEDVVVRGTYDSGRLHYVLFADRLEGEVIYEVHFIEFADEEPRRRLRDLQAHRGRFAGDGVWDLEVVVTMTFLPDDRVLTHRQDRLELFLGESPIQLKKLRTRDVQEMTYSECQEHIEALVIRGDKTRWAKQATQCEMKLAVPFAAFIFALLGVVLGCSWGRAGNTGMGLGLAIVVILFYYAMMMMALGLGKSGLDPRVSAWLPNVVSLGTALFMGWRRENPFFLR